MDVGHALAVAVIHPLGGADMLKPKAARKRKAKKAWRDPHDWYVEPVWCADLIVAHLAVMMRATENDMAWDPACGLGTFVEALQFLMPACGTDIVDRGADRSLWRGELDFLGPHGFRPDNKGLLHIVSNPPFKRAEAFARRALELATGYVAMLVPVGWLCSIGRHAFFEQLPPIAIAYLSNRPSMPPGAKIAELGKAAFKGGTTDYCVVIWDTRQPTPMTRAVWLKR